jgi:hypothetical protein
MVRYLIPIIVLAVLVYGFIDCVRTGSREVRGIPKAAWIAVIVVLPVVGVLLWFLLGRPTDPDAGVVGPAGPAPRSSPRRPVAPDDDPDFLRNLETARRNKAEAERLRRLKDELAAREREAKFRKDHNGEPGSSVN